MIKLKDNLFWNRLTEHVILFTTMELLIQTRKNNYLTSN